MTTAQVVETSVAVNNNSPIQDYVHSDDQTQPTFEMPPGFKSFTIIIIIIIIITRRQTRKENRYFLGLGVEWHQQYLISIIWPHVYRICKKNAPQKMWYMNRFWTLHLVLNGHLYKYTAETPFYDRRFNDIRDGTVSTDFCVQVKVTVNRLYHGFRRHFDE